MDLEFLNGKTGINIKDFFLMIKDKVLDKWSGKIKVFTSDNGKKEFKMVMVEWLILMVLLSKEYLLIMFLKVK